MYCSCIWNTVCCKMAKGCWPRYLVLLGAIMFGDESGGGEGGR